MAHVHITLSRDMLRALMDNLAELHSPAGEFIVEHEIDGINEITRIINVFSGDVFEQAVQKQDLQAVTKEECRIYEFPPKSKQSNEDVDNN